MMVAPLKHPKTSLRSHQAKRVRTAQILGSPTHTETELKLRGSGSNMPSHNLKRAASMLSAGKMQLSASPQLAQEEERQKRLQAIDLIFGIWKDHPDIAKDGLAYQEDIRSEW
jgi:hypothetical protein